MAMHSQYGEINIEITVDRDELLERLKENRENHRIVFERAIQKWQEDLRHVLETLNHKTCKSFPYELQKLNDECPESHLDEYDQAIDMFQMCVKEKVKIDSDAFNTFCRDEWGWKTYTVKNKYYRSIGLR